MHEKTDFFFIPSAGKSGQKIGEKAEKSREKWRKEKWRKKREKKGKEKRVS